jgi:TatD DNase family protein
MDVVGYDTHTHLDFSAFDADRQEVVARARAAGVASWLIADSDHDDWDRTERIARETGGIAALGVHPWSDVDASTLDRCLRDLRRRSPDVIGEIGLDALHARDADVRQRQRRSFRAQLDLARELERPVVLHCVRAYPEMLAILRRDGLPRAGGIVHAWSGPADAIEGALALGLYVAFGPLILRDRARKARASVRRVPLDRLLLETDCPNMAPLGKARGEPADLVAVLEGVAALREESRGQIWAAAAANARTVLPLLGR